MILIVLGLVALSYYPVVVAVYGPLMVNPDTPVATEVAAVFVVVSFHILVSAKRATHRERVVLPTPLQILRTPSVADTRFSRWLRPHPREG